MKNKYIRLATACLLSGTMFVSGTAVAFAASEENAQEAAAADTDQLDNVGAAGGPGGDAPKGNAPDGNFDPKQDINGDSTDSATPPELPENMSEDENQNSGGNQPTPPENMDGQGGNSGEMGAPDGQGGPGGMGSSSNGASLKYSDDEIDSYSDIFDNAETDVTEEDEERVIAALKGISESEGTEIEDYLDTDEVIRYFVAHNFTMNYDSYTGTMLHNYYLYENDGKLAMIPWDYNLAFGSFMGQGGDMNKDGTEATDATSIVNYGIDTPLSGTTEDDRPMWSWITSNEEYLEQYHEVFDELLTNYFESGDFEAEITEVYEMIAPYIAKDPTAFYTAEEVENGYETLKEFCTLRAESIRKQLSGELSTSTDEQESSAQVDASDITISDMGTQGGHGDQRLQRG